MHQLAAEYPDSIALRQLTSGACSCFGVSGKPPANQKSLCFHGGHREMTEKSFGRFWPAVQNIPNQMVKNDCRGQQQFGIKKPSRFAKAFVRSTARPSAESR
jgi:hypothetical protein